MRPRTRACGTSRISLARGWRSWCCCPPRGPKCSTGRRRFEQQLMKQGPENFGRCQAQKMTMDTSELGLERLVCDALTGGPRCPPAGRTVSGPHLGHGGVGWFRGNLHYYDWECRIDLVQFRTFLHTGQPDSAATFRFDKDCRVRRMLLARPQGSDPRARHNRHAPQRHQARLTPLRSLPRKVFARKLEGRATIRAEPLHSDPPTPLQQGPVLFQKFGSSTLLWGLMGSYRGPIGVS